MDAPLKLRSPRQCLAAFEVAAALIRSGSAEDRSIGRALTETISRASVTISSGVDRTIEKIGVKHRALLKELEQLRDENAELRAALGAKLPGGGLMPIALPRGSYPAIPPADVFDSMVARGNAEVDDDVIDCDVEDAVAEANEDDIAPEYTPEQLEQLREEQEIEARRRRGGRPRKNPLMSIDEARETPAEREARLKRIRENSLFHKSLVAERNAEIKAERAAAGLPQLPSCPQCRKVTKLDGTPCIRCFPPSRT